MLLQAPSTDLSASSPLPEDGGRDLSPLDGITVPESRAMLLTTVCMITVGSVPLTWVLRVDDARREQGGWINIFRAQRALGASLPGFLVLGIGFVPRNLRLGRGGLFRCTLHSLGSRFCRHDALAGLGRARFGRWESVAEGCKRRWLGKYPSRPSPIGLFSTLPMLTASVWVRCTACSSARSGGRRGPASGTADLLGMLIAPIFRHDSSVLAGSGSGWITPWCRASALSRSELRGHWHVWLCPCGYCRVASGSCCLRGRHS